MVPLYNHGLVAQTILQALSASALLAKSAQMALAIAELQKQATRLEDAPLRKAGTVDLEDVTHISVVLQAVLSDLSDGPSAPDILAWADSTLEGVRKRSDYSEAMPRRYFVVWAAGKISVEDSSIYIPAMAKRVVPAAPQDSARGTQLYRSDELVESCHRGRPSGGSILSAVQGRPRVDGSRSGPAERFPPSSLSVPQPAELAFGTP
jgi:hypothetical protein